MRNRLLFLNVLLISLLTIFMTGCFPEQKSQASKRGEISEPKSLITNTDFAGAISATNVVTGVKIVWSPSIVSASAYRVYRVNGANLQLLTSLSPNVSSYIDGSVIWGSVYTYVVRALDLKGVEETNNNQVSSLAWGGISAVAAAGRTAISVNFGNSTATADEIRIYVQGDPGEATKVVKTSGSTLSQTITGLRPGFTYKVTAQAYVNSLNKEDGNTVSWSVTTLTNGYDTDPLTGNTPAWMNVTNVRAFGPSPGAPQSPNDKKTPKTTTVELSFKSFNGYGSSAKYVVTRTPDGEIIDTSVPTPCTNTSTGSCRVVCNPLTSTTELSGSGILNCRDENAADSPARYRYTMSLVHNDSGLSWVEPLSSTNIEDFSVLVHIPPANMVLVQRNAVNYEMCSQQMNLTPNPLKFNRCEYSGIGATPYNTNPNAPPLNLTPGFYDFGYNLFIDRYEQACKWTRGVDGGKCNPGKTTGDCIAALDAAPDDSIGEEGNVFLRLNNGGNATSANGSHTCYYKYGNKWWRSGDMITAVPNTQAAYGQMYTSDPTANNGLVATSREGHRQYQAWLMCQAQSDPNYGQKRIPRLREQRAFSTFATVPNDLYYISYSTASSYSGGSAPFDATNGYRCPHNTNSTTYPSVMTVTSVASMLASTTHEAFVINNGSTLYGRGFRLNATANSDCQGRYGQSNVHNRNGWSWVSDAMAINSNTRILTGMTSMLDSGNIDLLSDLSGTQTGYQLNFNTATAQGTSSYRFNFSPTTVVNSMAIPLGLPILSSSITGYTSVATFPEHYGSYFETVYATGITTPRVIRTLDRWRISATSDTGNWDADIVRCVLPAE